jgi:PD-(D/E)XK nuclease superfamily
MRSSDREEPHLVNELPVPYPKGLAQFPLIRQSVLSSFDNCSLGTKFEFQYRHNWHFSYQARGELFHRFASKALVEMARQGERSIPVDAALAILHETLRQDDVDRWCPRCGSGRVRKGITRKGMRYCLACRQQFPTRIIAVPMDQIAELYWVVKKWAHDTSFDVHNLVDVEKRLEAEVRYPHPDGGWVPRTITGQMDALFVEGVNDERAIVLDWKDMWKLPPPTTIGHEGYFQQRFYALLIWDSYPSVHEVVLREFYVRYSKPREATLLREQAYDDVREEVTALVERFDRTVQNNEWIASPGMHCGFCAAPQKCTIFPEARGAGRITNPDEAEKVAAQYVVASAILKQQREQLAAWTRMHGPVPVKDAKGRRVVGHQEYERTERPSEQEIVELTARLRRVPTEQEIRALQRKHVATKLTTFVPDVQLEDDHDEQMILALQRSVEQADGGR